MLKSLLNHIDMFGTIFNFSTFGKEKFKTNLGCILTIFCAITIGIFTYFFGSNFFYRENPFVIKQTVIPENYTEMIDFSNKNTFFAWRLTDAFGNNFNYTGIITPRFRNYHYNNFNNTLMNYEELKTIPCDKSEHLDPDFSKAYKPEEWMCFDSKEYINNPIKFGGGFDTELISNTFLQLFTCSDDDFKEDSISSGRCKPSQYIKQSLSQGIYIDLVYPEYNFSPNDYNKPLKRIFKNYYYLLNFQIRKIERLYFEEVELQDDRGWILEDKNVTITHTAKERQTDLEFFNDNDYGKVGISSRIYVIFLFARKPYTLITRSYMKVQDLAAVVGGFFKFVLILGSVVSKYFGTFTRNEIFYNLLFDNEEPKVYNNFVKNVSRSNFRNNNNRGESNPERSVSIVNLPFNRLNNNNRTENVIPTNQIKSNLGNQINNDSSFNYINHNIQTNAVNQPFNPIKTESIKEAINLLNDNKTFQKVKFSFWEKMIPNFCKRGKVSGLEIVDKYLGDRLDVQFYLNNMEILDRIKENLYTKEENIVFRFMNKPNINVKGDMKKFVEEQEEVEKELEVFVNRMKWKIENGSFKESDKRIVDISHIEIRKLIYK